MKILSRLALLSALSVAALGCNLTYDREGLEFPTDLVCEGATPNRCEVTAGSPYCTDLATSASNCGDCGLSCAGTCSGGNCSGAVTCTAPLQLCNDGIKDYCANLSTDATDCGSCGISCGPQTCGSGFCHVSCGAAAPNEWLVPGVGWQCFDFQNDVNNCGSYGHSCGTAGCANGACLPAPACPPLATACDAGFGEYCSNLSEDPNNCGGCGIRCAAGTPCRDGVCLGSTCGATDWVADGLQLACADVQNDPYNCGSPGSFCPGVCLGGLCNSTGAGSLSSSGYDWNFWLTGTTVDEALSFGSLCMPGSGQPCVHLGEVRRVDLSTLPGVDCSNATADDELGLFEWACFQNPAPPNDSYLLSTGFKPGKGLADLIDGSLQWKPNAVRVRASGVYVGSTVRSGWWPNNPILPLPADGNLTTAGAIYVQPQNGKVNPNVIFGAPGTALVVLPGRVLSPTSVQPAVAAPSVSFTWIDGRIDARSAGGGVQLSNAAYSVVRGADLSTLPGNYHRGIELLNSSRVRVEEVAIRGFQYGLYVDSGADNRFAQVRVEDSETGGAYLYGTARITVDGFTARPGPARNTFGARGLEMYWSTDGVFNAVDVAGYGTGVVVGNGSTRNRLTDVAAAACTDVGVEIDDTSGNLLDGVVASENGDAGVLIWYGSGNALTDVLAVSNGHASTTYGAGIYLFNARDNRLMAVTASDNQVGLALLGARNNLIASGAFVRNLGGVAFSDSTGTLLADFAAGLNTEFGLYSDSTSQTKVTGVVLLGVNAGTGDCNVAAPGVNAGITGVGPCTFTLPSEGYQIFWLDPLDALAGYTAEDFANTSDSNGSRSILDFGDPSIDWFGFDRPHRAWIGAANTVLGCAGGWAPSSGACGGTWASAAQIFDWSLPTGSVLRGKLAEPSTLPIRTHLWNDTTTASFLSSAVEFPGINGNEDGLCDAGANEYCLWTPNIGAYQGHNTGAGWTNLGITQVPGANLSRYYFNGY